MMSLKKAGDISKIGQGIVGIFTGNPIYIAELVGENATRKLATQFLLNPRFQNLSDKFVTAINKGKVPAVMNIVDEMKKLVKKTKALDEDELDGIKGIKSSDVQDLIDALNQENENNQEN